MFNILEGRFTQTWFYIHSFIMIWYESLFSIKVFHNYPRNPKSLQCHNETNDYGQNDDPVFPAYRNFFFDTLPLYDHLTVHFHIVVFGRCISWTISTKTEFLWRSQWRFLMNIGANVDQNNWYNLTFQVSFEVMKTFWISFSIIKIKLIKLLFF